MEWEENFFNIIAEIRKKSKDPSTKVGALIVTKNNAIISTGFNGFPRGVCDSESQAKGFITKNFGHYKEGLQKKFVEEVNSRYERPKKYLYTEHAERNAIFTAAREGISLDGCTMYVDWIPCSNCGRAIIQSGIDRVVIDARDSDEKAKYWQERWADEMDATLNMFKESGVKLYRWKG